MFRCREFTNYAKARWWVTWTFYGEAYEVGIQKTKQMTLGHLLCIV